MDAQTKPSKKAAEKLRWQLSNRRMSLSQGTAEADTHLLADRRLLCACKVAVSL